MLILRPYQPRVLLPVPMSQWRAPSQAEWKDQFGNPGIRTRFRVDGLLDDGHRLWREWFEDRDEFDDFLWRLPRIPGVRYEFATVTDLTTTGSLLSFTSPADWNDAANTIEVLGGGGSGRGLSSNNNGTGGGGAGKSAIANLTFATPGTTTASYQVGAGGAAASGGSNAGGDSWFNGATLGVSSVGSKGGSGGASGTGATNGGAGGAAGSGVGTTKYSGGRGGNISSTGFAATGGGSAAADNANGNNGTDISVNNTSSDGGADPTGLGGAGGRGGGTGLTPYTSGQAGSNYGAGGGAHYSGAGGAGAPGIIRITYTPISKGAFFALF